MDEAEERRAERAAQAEYHTQAQRQRSEQESEKAQTLIDRFVAEASAAGLPTEELRVRPWSGRGRYRTGVTGWYLVDGVDTPVWNLNVGDATTAGWLYYLLPEYASRHPERVKVFADAVAEVGGLAAKVAQVRVRWSGWPSLPLTRASASPSETLAPVVAATR